VNEKRIELLKAGMILTEDLRAKNLNVKLCMGDFLLKCWQVIKSDN
jgi:hypothetical protein